MDRWYVLVALAWLVQSSPSSAGEPIGDLIRAVRPSIVRVEAEPKPAPDANPAERPMRQSASGFVWDEEGHVVTVSSVLEGAARIRVVSFDGASRDARPLGVDPGTGLAVVQVKGLPDPPLRLAADAELGQRVVAGGYAKGALRPFFSVGVVSDSAAPVSGIVTGCLQSDVVTPPGMGGGPLLATNGRLVGVNLAMAGETPGATVAFSLPAGEARRIVPLLIRGEVPRRGALSVEAATRDGKIEVTGFAKDSAASRSGLAVGDVIVGIAGQPVATAEQLTQIVRKRAPGDVVTVEIEREGKRKTISLALGEWIPGPFVSGDALRALTGTDVLTLSGSGEKVELRFRDQTFASVDDLARAVAARPPSKIALCVESSMPFAVVQSVIQRLQAAGAARVEIMIRRD